MRLVVRLLRYASASRLCQSSGMLCRLFCSVAYLPPFPFLGVVMRYTIPPLFFVSYVGIVSRHRLSRATNSPVPRCPVCALSVSAFLLSSIVPHGMRLVVRLLRYASASRLCQLSSIICRLFCSVASLPPFPFWGELCGIPYRLFSSLITSGLYSDIGFSEPPIVTCHGVLCARFL